MADRDYVDIVKSLLAKAKAIPFEAEAEAFRTKAYEMMAMHGIDEAMLANATPTAAEPQMVVLTIGPPFAMERTWLLHCVGYAFRCVTIRPKVGNDVIVVGYPADLNAAQVVYTSLAEQLVTALKAAEADRDPWVPLDEFRSAFILAFGQRAGMRLEEAHQAAADAHSDTPGVELALRSRHQEVKEWVAEHANVTDNQQFENIDRSGYTAGAHHGDLADIGLTRVGTDTTPRRGAIGIIRRALTPPT